MKRKTLTLAICFLALIAIVSVGFASWIITRPSEVASDPGSITAEAVTESGYQLSVATHGSSVANIHYGSVADSPKKGGNNWLSNDGSQPENLSYEMKLTSSKYEFMSDKVYVNVQSIEGKYVQGENEYVDILSTNKFQKPDSAAEQSKFNAAMAANYVAAPTITLNGSAESSLYKVNFEISKETHFGLMVKVDDDPKAVFKTVAQIKQLAASGSSIVSASASATVTVSDNVATITGEVYCLVKVNFNWGSYFGAKSENIDYEEGTALNPEVYYSYVAFSDQEATDATKAFNAIKAIADAETKYKVVFSDTAK